MGLYKLDEWQGASGRWYCGDTSAAALSRRDIQQWVVQARIWDKTPVEFIEFLINTYKPDDIFHNGDYTFVGFSWKSQQMMRKYKNDTNAKARQKNFQI